MEILFWMIVVLVLVTGLNKLLKPFADAKRTPKVEGSGSFADPLEKFNRLPITKKLDSNDFDFGIEDFDNNPEVVGESFYADAFEKIRAQLGLRSGEESTVEVELVNDPHNPHSPSGNAVAVFVMGHKVGHISESDSSSVFEQLDSWELGGKIRVRGRIYFSDNSRNSVQLLEFPFPEI